MLDDWLNDSAKVFFTREMNTKIYKTYSNLTVKCFDEESLLALKITSARELTNDANDAITLMKALNINSLDEVYDIVEKYIPAIRRTPKSYYFAEEVFEKYKIIKRKGEIRNE